MKRITLFLLLACLASCTNDLTRDEAAEIIKSELKFPRPYDFKVFRAEPRQAKIAVETNLEKEGFITVQRTQKAIDIGKPFIFFTDKAKPYLLNTSEEDIKREIQKVKIADEEFGEVERISVDGNKAKVVYTTHLKNISPMAALMPKQIEKTTASNKVTLVLYDDGWRLEKD